MRESFAAMRLVPLLLTPLALISCSQAAPSDAVASGAPSAPATMATTNATVEPVPTETVTASETPMASETKPLPASAPSSACGAEKVARFIGKAASPEVREQVAKAVGHQSIRWIGPDTAVTADFSEGRLNADLDAGGKIKGFRCG